MPPPEPNVGEICQIAEVLQDPRLQNRCVRITGRLEQYDATRELAKVAFQGASMAVETRLLANTHVELRIGSMYQFLGDTRVQAGSVCLSARVVRNVDNLDIDLYLQALELRRKFLASPGL
ncbi:TPA: hypothetical protein N0F65_012815 [Lagenidium giganteum]|uniref:CST complex subunit TEN1 n=1 Tax=Lagenidium giganteum TaxID=4803 RepID=A0AAV2YAG8_9STRA|nr:TPA: hypothetical protein N0F65_012815 [Lagenidium giganteum]